MDGYGFAVLLQSKIMPPSDPSTMVQIVLRWIHFLAGITWIGLLYFFNLVNVGFMKKLDGPTKGKVIPNLMPPALWYFRWGALVTVLAGLAYWILILQTEPEMGATLGRWFGLVVATFAIFYGLLRVPAIAKDGRILAVIVFLLVGGMGHLLVKLNTHDGASNRALSIGVGGGIGLIMLLNVWGVIWPAQKRIIAWTAANAEKGTAIPPESAVLGRRAFLASRTNAWLSIPMLFFMAAASHYPMFTGG